MTVAGDVTDEDRLWASEFIFRHFQVDYVMVLAGNLPKDAPNWSDLFHKEWSSAFNEGYVKAQWLRREKALLQELIAGYARLLGRNPPDDELQEIAAVVGVKMGKSDKECANAL